MIKKAIFLFFFFYSLALLQVSFFVHFPLAGRVPNGLWLATLLVSFLDRRRGTNGIASAISAGFFWDLFSRGPMGLHILILLLFALLVNLVLKKYVRVPTLKVFST